MTTQIKWMAAVSVFALALGFGVGSSAAAPNCDAQFKRCIADGHTPKAICLSELNECRRGYP